MSWFNLGRIAAKLVTSAMATRTKGEAPEGEIRGKTMPRAEDTALEHSFLASLDGILKDRTGQTAKQLMGYFL
nr:hypothetical protein [Candidatus Sigynarchaeum springense]